MTAEKEDYQTLARSQKVKNAGQCGSRILDQTYGIDFTRPF